MNQHRKVQLLNENKMKIESLNTSYIHIQHNTSIFFICKISYFALSKWTTPFCALCIFLLFEFWTRFPFYFRRSFFFLFSYFYALLNWLLSLFILAPKPKIQFGSELKRFSEFSFSFFFVLIFCFHFDISSIQCTIFSFILIDLAFSYMLLLLILPLLHLHLSLLFWLMLYFFFVKRTEKKLD